MGAQQAELDVPLELVFGAYRLAARVLWDEVIGQPAVLNDVPPSTVIGADEHGARVLRRDQRRGGRRLPGDPRAPAPPARPRSRPDPPAAARRRRVGGAAPHRGIGRADARSRPTPWWPARRPTHRGGAAARGDLAGRGRASDRRRTRAVDRAGSRGPRSRQALCRGRPGRLRRRSGRGDARRGRAVGAAGAPGARGGPAAVSRTRSVHTDAEVGVFAALADDHDAMRTFVDRVLGPLADGHAQPPARARRDARGAARQPEHRGGRRSSRASTATRWSIASAGSASSASTPTIPSSATSSGWRFAARDCSRAERPSRSRPARAAARRREADPS